MSWLRNLSLRSRSLLMTAVGLVMGLAAVGFLSVQALQASTERVLADRLRRAQLTAVQIDEEVAEVLGLLQYVALSEGFDLTDADPEPERHVLRELYRASRFTYEVFVTDKNGIVLLAEPNISQVIGANLSSQSHIRAALQTGQPQVSNLMIDPLVPKPFLSLVVPVRDKAGRLVGLIGEARDPADLIYSVEAGGSGGYIQVVDANGLVLSHSQGKDLFEPVEHPEVVLALLADKKPGVVTREVSEKDRSRFSEVIAFAPSRAAPWGVFVEQAESEVLAPVYELRQRLMLIGAAILLLGGIFAWLTTQAVVEPIHQLLAATRRVTTGDLSTPVPITGRDEVTELARGFEAMRRRLAAWGQELETAVQNRTRELSVLYAIDRTAAESLDLDAVLNKSLDKVLEVLDVEAGGILLLEPDGVTLTQRVHRGISNEFVKHVQRMRVDEGMPGRAIAAQKPVVLDVLDYPQRERVWPLVVREGFRTLASTPLLSGGQAQGVLSLGTRRPRAFPPEDLALLAAIGQQLGQAVANAQLFQKERQARQIAEALRDATATLVGSLELDQVLDCILDEVQRVIPYDAANIALLEGERVHFVRWRGYERFGVDTRVPGLGFHIADTPNYRFMAETGQPKVVPDTTLDPGWIVVPGWEWIRCYVGVPIRVRNKLIGFLNLDSTTPGFFNAEHGRLLATFAHQIGVAIENARLFEAERERSAQLDAIARIAARITSILNPDELLRETVKLIVQTFGYYHVAIMLLDPQTNELVFQVAAGGYASRTPPGFRQKLGEGMIGWVAYTGETLLANDVSREPRYIAPFLTDTRSELDVPLKHRGRVIGVLDLQSKEVNAFSQHDVIVMETLAGHIATAVENARLFAEERRRATQLTIVNEVSRHATSTLDLDQILHDVTQAIQTGFGYHSVIALLVEGEYAVLKAIAGSFAEVVVGDYRQHLSQGIIGWAITHDQTVLANDVSRDPHYIPGCLGNVLTQSELCVPIRVDRKVIGALDVQTTELNAFDQWDVVALEILADQVALALKNALAYRDLDEEKERLELLYEVAAAVNRSLELDDILTQAVERITTRLGGQVGYVFLVEPGTDRLRLRAIHGVDVPIAKLNEGLDVHLGQGLVGWVAAHGQPAIVDDVTRDERWLYIDELDRGIRSVIAVPLMRGAEVLGALSVLHPTPGFFGEVHSRLLVAITQQVAVAVANARLHETVREQAMLDSLTQVYNHGELIRRLHMAVEEATRERRPVSFIMLDIDYFKEYNDRYGHVTGDLILKAIVQAIRAHIKKTDVVGRWGGEEFGIVLPHSDGEQAQVVAERIQHTLATIPLTDDKGNEVPKPTVSQGIATYPTTATSADELIDRADAALYWAKAGGRNQIHVA